jgi:hypothetical protein
MSIKCVTLTAEWTHFVRYCVGTITKMHSTVLADAFVPFTHTDFLSGDLDPKLLAHPLKRYILRIL